MSKQLTDLNNPQNLPSTEVQGEPEKPTQPGSMGFFEHLEELRNRLLKALIAVVIGVLASAVFTPQIIDYLSNPYRGDLVILDPTGSIVIYFRVALMSGAILAIPYVTYQLFLFIIPGLTDKEKKWVLMAIPATTFFFLLGVAFAWFVMVPAAFGFLQDFSDPIGFEDQWTADRYFSFLTTVIFWIGMAFEMPIIFFVLARLGLVGPGTLMRNWRFAVVAVTVVAAMITPTVDPFNMLLVMAPLLALYGVSIVLVTFAARRIERNISSSTPS